MFVKHFNLLLFWLRLASFHRPLGFTNFTLLFHVTTFGKMWKNQFSECTVSTKITSDISRVFTSRVLARAADLRGPSIVQLFLPSRTRQGTEFVFFCKNWFFIFFFTAASALRLESRFSVWIVRKPVYNWAKHEENQPQVWRAREKKRKSREYLSVSMVIWMKPKTVWMRR